MNIITLKLELPESYAPSHDHPHQSPMLHASDYIRLTPVGIISTYDKVKISPLTPPNHNLMRADVPANNPSIANPNNYHI